MLKWSLSCRLLLLYTLVIALVSSNSTTVRVRSVENSSQPNSATNALPGFNIGSRPWGLDIAKNGISVDWEKWDPSQTFARANISRNEFYAWYLPRYDPSNKTFTIKSSSVVNSTRQPNEANCSVTTNPAVGQPIIAGNFSTGSFSSSYECTSIGQVEIQIVIEIQGYSDVVITYIHTNGNALDIGTTPTGSEVMVLGTATSNFLPSDPNFTVVFDMQSTLLYLRIDSSFLPYTKSETITQSFTAYTIPEHVIDVNVSGNASLGAVISHSNLELTLAYECKISKPLSSTTIVVRYHCMAARFCSL